jgi:hypothetical protein
METENMNKTVGYWRPLKDSEVPGEYWTSVDDDVRIRWASEPGYVDAGVMRRAGVSTREEYVEQRTTHAQARAEADLALPVPVEGSLAADDAERLAAWLDAGADAANYRGFSSCRLCARLNGTGELQRDGFQYPDGLIHYVRDHRVAVPGLEHVVASLRP